MEGEDVESASDEERNDASVDVDDEAPAHTGPSAELRGPSEALAAIAIQQGWRSHTQTRDSVTRLQRHWRRHVMRMRWQRLVVFGADALEGESWPMVRKIQRSWRSMRIRRLWFGMIEALQGRYLPSPMKRGEEPVNKWYSPAMCIRRERIWRSERMQLALERAWAAALSTASDEGATALGWFEYAEIFRKIYLAITRKNDPEEALELAKADWEHDTRAMPPGAGIDHFTFTKSWFELADVNTDVMDEEAYVEFIEELIGKIVVTSESKGPVLRSDFEIMGLISKEAGGHIESRVRWEIAFGKRAARRRGVQPTPTGGSVFGPDPLRPAEAPSASASVLHALGRPSSGRPSPRLTPARPASASLAASPKHAHVRGAPLPPLGSGARSQAASPGRRRGSVDSLVGGRDRRATVESVGRRASVESLGEAGSPLAKHASPAGGLAGTPPPPRSLPNSRHGSLSRLPLGSSSPARRKPAVAADAAASSAPIAAAHAGADGGSPLGAGAAAGASPTAGTTNPPANGSGRCAKQLPPLDSSPTSSSSSPEGKAAGAQQRSSSCAALLAIAQSQNPTPERKAQAAPRPPGTLSRTASASGSQSSFSAALERRGSRSGLPLARAKSEATGGAAPRQQLVQRRGSGVGAQDGLELAGTRL